MVETSIINVEVTPQAPIIVETQTESVNVQIGNDSALGAVTQGVIDLHKKVDDFANKQVDVDLTPVAKEATLIAKVAELKEALNTIDLTAIEQAIQNVQNVTAREATLIQGVGDIIKAVENIDFTDLENSIAEVKNAVANIDFSALAKEETLTQVQSKVEEVGNKIDNIKLPEIDATELAKQGENIHATNTAIYESLKSSSGYVKMTSSEYDEYKAHIIEVTNNILN
jgi:hypothetical protein